MSALAMALLLTGAGPVTEMQDGKPVPAPMVVYPPAPPPIPYADPRLRGVAPPQRVRANLNSYFSPDDYPAAALRSNEQGTVGFRLTIGPNGRVSYCQVTLSSGSVALDAATCRIMRSRARYTPARDAAGEPTTGVDSGRVTWRLPLDDSFGRGGVPFAAVAGVQLRGPEAYISPADYPLEALRAGQSGTSVVRVVVGPAGRVVACDVARSSGSAALDAAACRLVRTWSRYTPPRDAAGANVCDVDVAEIAWTLPPPRPLPRRRIAAASPPPPLERQLSAALCPGWPAPVPTPPPPLRRPGTPYPYPVIAQPPPRISPPIRARANLQTYFSDDDYPAAALRANAGGVTGVRLTVGPDGRISGCTVTASSGSAALDQATCRILRSRARYAPARDAEGTAISGTDNGRIRWTLPAD